MKKGLIILFIFIISIFIFWYGKKDKEIESSKDIAFYYEKDTGSYEQSTDSKWNSGDYALNVQNSICNGEKNPAFLSWNDENNSIILKRNKSTNCTLYFDKKRKFTLLSNYPIEGSERELTNILGKDGDFENIEPWNENNYAGYLNNVSCELSKDIKSHGKTSCKVQGTSENVETLVHSSKFFHTDINHYYYVKLKAFNSTSLSITGEFFWPPVPSDKALYFSFNVDNSKSWMAFSYLNQNTKYQSNDIRIRLDNNNSKNEVDLYFDELMLIDLTASYGDNIPTKEELDNTLIYFDDTVYMKSVMGLQGEFKVTGVSDNQEIECNNDGQAKISNGVVTITGDSPYITCYLK